MTARIVEKEVDRDATLARIELERGVVVECAVNVRLLEGGTLHLSGVHVNGGGHWIVGVAGLRAAVRQLASSWGVRRVVIDGGDRVTGAATGPAGLGVRAPRRLVLDLE